MSERDIRIRYSTIDGFYESRRFKTLAGARAYARKRIGTTYDIGETFGYAVDMHGIGKITASGATLEELLSDEPPAPPDDATRILAAFDPDSRLIPTMPPMPSPPSADDDDDIIF